MDRLLLPLVDGFPDGLRAAMLVEWRIGSHDGSLVALLVTSAR